MTVIAASAPGKAVLSGEYAVLRGAPAISMAVDRRATVRLAITEDDFHRVSMPGLAAGSWRFAAAHAGAIEWLDEPPRGGAGLVEQAWRSCADLPPASLSIAIDTREFFDPQSGSKLGLGSSAASMTALVAALCQHNPRAGDAGSLAARAHRAWQGGLGSGVDVATSVHGGVIEYRKKDAESTVNRPWPDGLFYRFLWSGHPADTALKIRRLAKTASEAAGWTTLLAKARNVVSAWADADVAALLLSLRHYTDALRQFGVDHDLGIFDAGHDVLADLAATRDIVYKPCGAGGGDIGVVLAADDASAGDFCDHAEEIGYRRLPITLDLSGIRISVEDER